MVVLLSFFLILAMPSPSHSVQLIAHKGHDHGPPRVSAPKFEPRKGAWYAIFETGKGVFRAELFLAYAPKTVRNFIALAKGEKKFKDLKTGEEQLRPFYNDLIFHRVIKGFIIQTGCPLGDGTGGPGYPFPEEKNDLEFDRPGRLAMAREESKKTGEPLNSGSQFFISLNPQSDFNKKYTIFGQVVDGMDVITEISKVPTSKITDKPKKDVVIKRVEIVGE